MTANARDRYFVGFTLAQVLAFDLLVGHLDGGGQVDRDTLIAELEAQRRAIDARLATGNGDRFVLKGMSGYLGTLLRSLTGFSGGPAVPTDELLN